MLITKTDKVVLGLVLVAAVVSTAAAAADQGTFSQAQICRAGIAAMMGKDPAIVKIAKESGGMVELYYIRTNDQTKWAYRCKLEGSRVMWASDPGRWRNDPRDEVLTFRVEGDTIHFTERYEDGSSSKWSFKKSALGK